jgi:hypothetical protein
MKHRLILEFATLSDMKEWVDGNMWEVGAEAYRTDTLDKVRSNDHTWILRSTGQRPKAQSLAQVMKEKKRELKTATRKLDK